MTGTTDGAAVGTPKRGRLARAMARRETAWAAVVAVDAMPPGQAKLDAHVAASSVYADAEVAVRLARRGVAR